MFKPVVFFFGMGRGEVVAVDVSVFVEFYSMIPISFQFQIHK